MSRFARVTSTVLMLAALTCAFYIAMPAAWAKPNPSIPKVPCSVLDQIQESLDNDINIDGVRNGLTTFFASDKIRITADALNGINHGVQYMDDINQRTPVPGLSPLLGRLQSSVHALNDAVNSLRTTQVAYGTNSDWSGGTYSIPYQYPTFTDPGPGTWSVVDDVGDKRDAIYHLIGTERASGCV